MSDETIQAALEYRERGWRIIPVHGVVDDKCTCGKRSCKPANGKDPRGKHPVHPEWQNAPAMSVPDIYATWQDTPYNIGILTGTPSGFFVVDVDPDSGGNDSMRELLAAHGPLPATRMHHTGGNGSHVLFAMPDFDLGNSNKGLTDAGYHGIDVRGTGGFVVAPPSVSGKGAYKIIRDDAPVPAPNWLTEALRPKEAVRLTITDVEADTAGLPREEVTRLTGYTGSTIENVLTQLDAMAAAAVPYSAGYTGPPWNKTSFDVACVLVEFGNTPWAPYALTQAQEDFFARAPRDSGFTDKTVDKIWRSAVAKVGDKARAIPPRPASSQDWVSLLPTAANGQPQPEEPAPAATEDELAAAEAARYEADIVYEARRIKIRTEAKTRVDLEIAAATPFPPFDVATAAELHDRPKGPPARIEGLLPSLGSMLVVAQRKTGKTTLLLNMGRCLTTGEPFLGSFNVRPVEGSIVFLNYEISAEMLGEWTHDVGVDPFKFLTVNLRGRRNPLIHDREELAAELKKHHVSILMVDPFSHAYGGASQNDSAEVLNWLAELKRFSEEVGASELILSTHAGWLGERSRGASALEDWPDSIITMVRKEDDPRRFIKAIGRDVDLEEDELYFDKTTRLLRLSGHGSRKATERQENVNALIEAIVIAIADEPGINASGLTTALRAAGHPFRKGEELQAARTAEGLGLVEIQVGLRGARLHYPTPRVAIGASCASCGLRAYELVDGVATCQSCKRGT